MHIIKVPESRTVEFVYGSQEPVCKKNEEILCQTAGKDASQKKHSKRLIGI